MIVKETLTKEQVLDLLSKNYAKDNENYLVILKGWVKPCNSEKHYGYIVEEYIDTDLEYVYFMEESFIDKGVTESGHFYERVFHNLIPLDDEIEVDSKSISNSMISKNSLNTYGYIKEDSKSIKSTKKEYSKFIELTKEDVLSMKVNPLTNN